MQEISNSTAAQSRVYDIHHVNIPEKPADPDAPEEKNSDQVHISSEAIRQYEKLQENSMTVNSAPTASYANTQVNQPGVYQTNKQTAPASFNDYLKTEPSKATNKASDELISPETSLQVSFGDPWPADHPLKKEADKFQELFKQTYNQVMDEKGYDAHDISESEMEEIRHEVTVKLCTDKPAVQLMIILNINLVNDGPLPKEYLTPFDMHISEMETQVEVEEWLDKHVWLRSREHAIYKDLGEADYKTLINSRQHDDAPYIPGLLDHHSSFVDSRGEKIPFWSTKMYEIHLLQVHDEVAAELGLDVSKIKEGSSEALAALKIIGERIMADPKGQQYMANYNLTHISPSGLPTTPYHITGDNIAIAPTPNPLFSPDNDNQPIPSHKQSDPHENKSGESPVFWDNFVKSLSSSQLAIKLQLMSFILNKPEATRLNT